MNARRAIERRNTTISTVADCLTKKDNLDSKTADTSATEGLERTDRHVMAPALEFRHKQYNRMTIDNCQMPHLIQRILLMMPRLFDLTRKIVPGSNGLLNRRSISP